MKRARLYGAIACLAMSNVVSADIEQLVSGFNRYGYIKLHTDGSVSYLGSNDVSGGGSNGVLARTGFGTISSWSFSSQANVTSAAANDSFLAYGVEASGTTPARIYRFDYNTGTTTKLVESGLGEIPLDWGMGILGMTPSNQITFSASAPTSLGANPGQGPQGFYSISASGSVKLLKAANPDPANPTEYISLFYGGANTNGDVMFESASIIDPTTGAIGPVSYMRTNGGSAPVKIVDWSIPQAAPGGNGTFVQPAQPGVLGIFTDSNRFTTYARLTGTSGGTSDDTGLFSFGPGGVRQLVREGQALPGSGFVRGVGNGITITPDESVIFDVVSDNSSAATFEKRLYRLGVGGQFTELARTGQIIPNSAEVMQSLTVVPKVRSTRNDLALFYAASASSTSSGGGADFLLMTDGVDTVEVARKANFGLSASGGSSLEIQQASINGNGDVVFTRDGSGVIYRYSPDLTWKNATSVWEDAANWTFGLTPGARNTVSIDDANGSAVTGPATDTTVKAVRVGVSGNTNSLTLGTGNLMVGAVVEVGQNSQIDLNGKSVTVGAGVPETTADTMRVYAGGALGGTGTIVGNVINDGGTVGPGFSPGALAIQGSYTQTAGSVLNIELSGLGSGEFDQLLVSGDVVFEPGSIINFDFINGFAPTINDNIDFLTASNVMGDLSLVAFTYSGLLDGFQFDTTISGNTFSFTALNDGVAAVSSVPVPATVWLFGSGLMGFLGLARRREQV